MSMEDFYDHMKSALRHFGLQFAEMAKVAVSFTDEGVCFEHDGLRITILGTWK